MLSIELWGKDYGASCQPKIPNTFQVCFTEPDGVCEQLKTFDSCQEAMTFAYGYNLGLRRGLASTTNAHS
jgi:hypothetical protein